MEREDGDEEEAETDRKVKKKQGNGNPEGHGGDYSKNMNKIKMIYEESTQDYKAQQKEMGIKKIEN